MPTLVKIKLDGEFQWQCCVFVVSLWAVTTTIKLVHLSASVAELSKKGGPSEA